MFSAFATFLAVSCLTSTVSGWYMNNEGTVCPSPYIKFGSYDPMAYYILTHNVGTKITFACDDGYILDGPAYAYCRIGGTWTQLPTCTPEVRERSCVLPEKIDNAIYIEPQKTHYKVGDIVTFDCTGYKKIDGHGVSRCGENGRFDPLPPRCVAPQCDAPRAPINGLISPVRESYIVGEVITFECEEGFDLIGDVNATCQDDGLFTESSNLCSTGDVDRTCKLPKAEPGVIYDSSRQEFIFGESVSYSCELGFKQLGSGQLVCLPSTEWSAKAKCQRPKRTSCIRPKSPINGRLQNEKKVFYKLGQKVKFVCFTGFEIKGETNELVCGNDGVFYPSPPKCERSQSRYLATDSCKGRCHSRNSRKPCQCDMYCLMGGDCCSDFEEQCFIY